MACKMNLQGNYNVRYNWHFVPNVHNSFDAMKKAQGGVTTTQGRYCNQTDVCRLNTLIGVARITYDYFEFVITTTMI